jgi:hypothetical protein
VARRDWGEWVPLTGGRGYNPYTGATESRRQMDKLFRAGDVGHEHMAQKKEFEMWIAHESKISGVSQKSLVNNPNVRLAIQNIHARDQADRYEALSYLDAWEPDDSPDYIFGESP